MPAEPPGKSGRRPVRIGKYEVVKHVATGGMGAVYKAIDTELGCDVALKVLSPELAARPIVLERFKREARSAAKLHHENIVAVYDVGETAGTHYIALEFVEGMDLHEFIARRRRLEPELARRILIQAARALAHAHAQAIIHRDIKPSNFLVTKRDGEILVKLTDFGLARETRDEECRVTRLGTTVGTIDYMAPEQARSATAADVRSDIYSLGCTFYHMLAGTCPFPDGSVTERVYKHVEAEPPDVRSLNPDVPPGLVAILNRMLAKKPGDRYQTPQQLLEDLEQPEGGAEELPRLLPLEEPPAPPAEEAVAPRPPSTATRLRVRTPSSEEDHPAGPPPERPARRSPKKKRPRDEAAEQIPSHPARRSAPSLPSWWPYAALGIGLAAVLLIVVLVVTSSGDPPPQKDAVEGPPAEIPKRKKRPVEVKKEKKKVVEKGPGRTGPLTAAEVARLRTEFEGPLADFPEAPKGATVFRVGRGLTPGADAFRSLAEACARAPKDRHTVIEIHDSGPLFEPSIPAIPGRSLTVRGGGGFRPLIAWDGGTGKFLAVAGGSLTLVNLDVVAKAPDDAPEASAVLFEVTGGDVAARGCTFSVAGKYPRGVQVVRLDGQGARCRLRRCYFRGEATALAVSSPSADVLIDGCLVVGGDLPLLDFAVPAEPPGTLRLVRSTLVAGKNLLRVTAASGKAGGSSLKCLGWDSLLSHAGAGVEGDMVQVAGDTGRVKWRSVGCVYAGWEKLLAAERKDVLATAAAWHAFAGAPDGDKVLPAPWPTALPTALGEADVSDFATKGAAVHVPASAGRGPVGCDAAKVPAGRASWLVLTYERMAPPPLALPGDDPAPPIPTMNDGRYHGEEIALSAKLDLGHHLRVRLQNMSPGPKVVLHLTGSGEYLTSPLQVRGADLIVYFKGKDGKPPPTLAPNPATSTDRAALIEVEGGSLEMNGARIAFPNKVTAMPAHAIRVQGGSVRLFDCHLTGPLGKAPEGYQGLILLEGSGQAEPQQVHGCALHQCVLVSGKAVVRVQGRGARLLLRQCAVVSVGDALQFNPGPAAKSRLNVQCLLARNTVAVRGAVVALKDAARMTAVADPILVEAEGNLFLDPFSEAPRQSALLRFEGAALARGLLLWRGRGNGYDRRLRGYVAAEADAAPAKQPHAVWAGLWGKTGERQASPVEWPAKAVWTFAVDRPQLERLRLPPKAQAAVGADLSRLGLLKKK